jgi:cytochrome c
MIAWNGVNRAVAKALEAMPWRAAWQAFATLMDIWTNKPETVYSYDTLNCMSCHVTSGGMVRHGMEWYGMVWYVMALRYTGSNRRQQ